MKAAIGFIGSAVRETEPKKAKLARELGRLAAEKGFIVFSGACPGYPLEAARGAKEGGATVIGISPAQNLEMHKKEWDYPTEEFDAIVFTGLGRARNFLLVRACDALVVLEGRVGTLNEITCAYDEGKIIAVMEGMGGIASHMRELKKWFSDSGKKTGAQIIFAKKPEELMEKIEGLLGNKI
ncbi:MAG: LOG family protein [Candidatus Diapherotrites archaeon]|nr:LOG family protein [Candidatus Diapherotrites archaeon]